MKKNDAKNTPFAGNKSLKLVVPCLYGKRNDDLIMKEYLCYQLYKVITPYSFNVRLANLTLGNASGKHIKSYTTVAFFIEDDDLMADRFKAKVIDSVNLHPRQMQDTSAIRHDFFEFMIANTDWSTTFFHNIKVIETPSRKFIAVPYDFDQSGVVNTPYAKPAAELEMNSVRERRYRGYCMEDTKRFDEAIALYNLIKAGIYKLYTDCPLLDAKYIKATLQYFDGFYKTINDPSALKKEFSYPCDKNGTGNVVIRGLKDD